MFHHDVLSKMRKETSGARALEYILRFWMHDRLSTFPGYHRAAAAAAEIMREIGLSRVEIIEYPTTGKNLFSDWEGPQGWDAISGILEVTAPDGTTRRIADRRADPCHLMLWCGSTPPKGLKAKIVRADTKKSIKGKLLFQDTVPLDDKLRTRIIEQGALGVISDELPYWPEARVREENMHLVRWHNAFLFPQNRENLLAFSIKPVDGDWLRSLLDKNGEVEAFARVETRLYDDSLPVTTVVIPGVKEPEKEVWLTQHLHEIGAHDNASGVGTAIEAARAILDLVRQGKLEPPQRTIRVICSWEVIGFLAHITAHPEIAKQTICAFNPDMVGANQDICKSWLQIYVEPHNNPSFIDDLTIDLTRELYKDHPRWHWEVKPFMINDNFLADPLIDIPCPSLIFLRDRFYHTSSDRPENLSTEVMGEMAGLLAAGVYTVTNGGWKAAGELAEVIYNGALHELVDMAAEHKESQAYDERLQYLMPVLEKRLDSVQNLAFTAKERGDLSGKTRSLKKRLALFAETARPAGKKFTRKPATKLEREAHKIVPVRKIWGSYSLARVPKKVKQQRNLADFSSWSYDHNIPIFWADGKRSVFEIQWLIGHESGKTPKLDELMTLFKTLEEYKYFSLKKR